MGIAHRIAGFCVVVLLFASSGNAAVSDIADAAMKKNIQAVRSLLQQQANVDASQADGATALHWAVRWDDMEMVELLIRAGANVRASNRFGVTPLSLSSINGNAAIVGKLLTAGADPNGALSDLGDTPLMVAARTGKMDTVKVLLNHGAKVNGANSGGQTALMWAASERHSPVVKMLIEHRADVNARSNVVSGAPPAADPGPVAGGPEDMAFQKIDSQADIDAKLALLLDFEKQFPQSSRLLDVYQYLIQIYEKKNDLPKLGEVRGKAVNFRFGNGNRSRQNSKATGGITALMFAARENSLESGRILLDAGADVNATMANGSTALLMAILNANYEFAALLLDRGANPNLVDSNGKGALYAAVEMRNYQRTDTPGPVTDPADALNLAKAILDRGANPNARLTAKPPYRGGINRHWLPEPGATPFYRAAVSGDVTLMRLLLAYGADPYITASDSTTPLMVAAGVGFMGRGETHVWPEKEALEALELCLELGNVNATNANGLTALHAAAFRGWNAGVQTLVNRGAKLDAKDRQGRTPLNWADGSFRNARQPHTIALIEKLMQ